MASFAHLLLALFIGLLFLSTPTLSRKMHFKNIEENTISPSKKILFHHHRHPHPHPPAPTPKCHDPPTTPIIWTPVPAPPPTQGPTVDALARSFELS
uniref:Transmembrane protein n=1 Tax=Solanum lycopersicum TaxID=4081 RepID=A0A3Q7I8F7_SOLLC